MLGRLGGSLPSPLRSGTAVGESRKLASFDALFDAHWPFLVAFAQRRLADQQVAEEVAAEVFRIAWQKWNPDDPFGRPWLIRVAINLIGQQYRTAQRRRVAEESAADALTITGELDDALELARALDQLSETDRDAVRQYYWDGLSADEIAVSQGKSVGAVWTTLSRARSRLRTLLSVPASSGGEPS